jgi:hypothetical protein
MEEKDECPPEITSSIKSLSSSAQATNVRIENERNAAFTLNVLTALSFLPVKGNASGPLLTDWDIHQKLWSSVFFSS